MRSIGYQFAIVLVLSLAAVVQTGVSAGSGSLTTAAAVSVVLAIGAYGVLTDQSWGWGGGVVAALVLLFGYAPSFTTYGQVWPHGVLAACGVWLLGGLLAIKIREPEHAH